MKSILDSATPKQLKEWKKMTKPPRLTRAQLTQAIMNLQQQNNLTMNWLIRYIDYKGDKSEFVELIKAEEKVKKKIKLSP